MKKQNKNIIGIGGVLAAAAGLGALLWSKFGGNEDDEVMEVNAEDVVDADFEEVADEE